MCVFSQSLLGTPGNGHSGALARHAEAGIELRIVPNLGALWKQVIASTLEFSGIRLRNLGKTG